MSVSSFAECAPPPDRRTGLVKKILKPLDLIHAFATQIHDLGQHLFRRGHDAISLVRGFPSDIPSALGSIGGRTQQMTNHRILAAGIVLSLGWGGTAYPCSSFAVSSEDEVLLAKNFDWHFGGGYLVKNPSGVTRRALPLFGGEPATWTATFGSLTFTQYGAGLPYGGINQRGLAIEMLWLDETVYPSGAPRAIGELEWIQLQLDTRATVAEVLAGADELSIRPVGGKIHYVLADASGDRALLEFIDGAARVHRGGAGALVCTNDTQALSELAFDKLRSRPLSGSSSRVRYAHLRLDLDGLADPPSVQRAFAALERVAERGVRYRTQWAAIYELRKARIHVKTLKSGRPFTIDAGALDYRPESGTTFKDLSGRKLATDRFVPLTASAQRALARRNLPKVGIDAQVDAIADFLREPSTATVHPLLNRATLRVGVRTRAPGGFARIAVFANARELATRKTEHAGSVLLDATRREFAFYNLPKGTYAVGAFHDLDQDGRPGEGEPLEYFRPDTNTGGTGFAELAFELKDPEQSVEIVFGSP